MRRIITALATVAIVMLTITIPSPAQATRVDRPLPQAHAHNDDEHERPLHDALANGFTSVEADVWLVDGELLVAHDLDEVRPDRTLGRLYLEPLARQARQHHGSVYRHRANFQLLIDLKNEGGAAYTAVETALAHHPDVITTVTQRPHGHDRVRRGAVDAAVSGDRPLTDMQQRTVRRARYDGRLSDLGGPLPASFMPLVSVNWTKHFTWAGAGPMPAAEQQLLHRIVEQPHRAGQRVRFWAADRRHCT